MGNGIKGFELGEALYSATCRHRQSVFIFFGHIVLEPMEPIELIEQIERRSLDYLKALGIATRKTHHTEPAGKPPDGLIEKLLD